MTTEQDLVELVVTCAWIVSFLFWSIEYLYPELDFEERRSLIYSNFIEVRE